MKSLSSAVTPIGMRVPLSPSSPLCRHGDDNGEARARLLARRGACERAGSEQPPDSRRRLESRGVVPPRRAQRWSMVQL